MTKAHKNGRNSNKENLKDNGYQTGWPSLITSQTFIKFHLAFLPTVGRNTVPSSVLRGHREPGFDSGLLPSLAS